MDLVEDMFMSCCVVHDKRISTDAEWESFVKRLTSAQVITANDSQELNAVWT
eukprot:CAMPEP_0203751518 /NCGR_PEP_ID=MMETSP0098-20131031/5575_1 /ASSEMBLY_ACC=CAM_ASM_000208 /TAXON_ID=96639 /ORGANISM=" , Strain NY0313808BC1" /LENGTH=51 /DNA_ID=CAMNT_0050641263 /DNA_START=144 /DNA_END=295 /DNA_ORIENTATION=+